MITSTDILKGKILIVDDQQINILLLERMLRAAGYDSISSSSDPSQVCELYIKNRYDLILLDLQMPGLDGFEVMEALKKIEPDGYMPVLVITAQPGHKLHALQAGAKDFISKPFELAEVLARVHNLLEVRLLHKKLHEYNEALEQRVHEQTTMLAISHTLASTLELQPDLILSQLHEIIAYTHGGLFALEGSALVSLATHGIIPVPERDGIILGPGGDGLPETQPSTPIHIHVNTPEALAALINAHQPIRIADVWSDDPQAIFFRSVLDDDTTDLLEGMQSWMWVPLAVQGRLLGGLCFAETTKNFFTEHHAALGLSAANESAITMRNAELAGQAQALAVSEERQRLAHDLHDAVNQSLFSASLIAEALPRLWELNQQDARHSLEELRVLTRGALAEMRVLLAELRPSGLTDARLGDLLRLQGTAFSGRTNVPVALTVVGEGSLPGEVQMAFYRVCQEALHNISRHAKASHVTMDLRQDLTGIEMRIRDDGLGFDIAQTRPGHYGLGIMREHAEGAQTELSVVSQPGHGTELTMLWKTTPLLETV